MISHCEDLHLAGDGVAHEGAVATRLGLKPIPAAAEEAMVAREVVLARQTGARVHIAHVSTRGSVSLLAAAKAEGLAVTAEATPHHLTLTDEAISGFDTATKVNPPLRSAEDREALCRALAEGIIDVVATDHAPHGLADKDLEFDAAANGIVGLETALPLVLRLVAAGACSAASGDRRPHLETGPDPRCPRRAARAGRPGGHHARRSGGRRGRLSPDNFFSKGRNSPFRGWRLTGRVRTTIVGGRTVFHNGVIVGAGGG